MLALVTKLNQKSDSKNIAPFGFQYSKKLDTHRGWSNGWNICVTGMPAQLFSIWSAAVMVFVVIRKCHSERISLKCVTKLIAALDSPRDTACNQIKVP